MIKLISLHSFVENNNEKKKKYNSKLLQYADIVLLREENGDVARNSEEIKKTIKAFNLMISA